MGEAGLNTMTNDFYSEKMKRTFSLLLKSLRGIEVNGITVNSFGRGLDSSRVIKKGFGEGVSQTHRAHRRRSLFKRSQS